MNTFPTLDIERATGAKIVAGVDEAGRGPLCGPVVAAAVIIPANAKITCKINDSKKMTARARAVAFDWIMENCAVGVGLCSPEEIDEINILNASMLAMRRALDNLPHAPDFVLVDGNKMPDGVNGLAIVGGDAKSLSIAAASVIAKQTRDKIMCNLATKFPEYGWDKNSGYPTAAHLQAMRKFGINEHYRKSYKPVKELL
ncbi:MAG: ribonuclease HII [Rickettsiales bacterium]|jgi:ribonuclease HII|nr:ribonuclease HII [Rickettsiales bacterium]